MLYEVITDDLFLVGVANLGEFDGPDAVLAFPGLLADDPANGA